MSEPVRKQPNSQMCFICGMDNPIGLKAFFYEQSDGSVRVNFTPRPEHQGYPGVLHGGIITALLDETLGRASMTQGREQWMMTAKLELRFLKPVPIGKPLTVIGRVEKLSRVGMTGRGEIRLDDGSVAVEASGLFVTLPPAQKDDLERLLPVWTVVPDEPDAGNSA
ncbi:MAG: PaaI family thioesterase [Chloroflexi bacterium]|nr:PaaI family thioesterase [Chloroflexota bacterium]